MPTLRLLTLPFLFPFYHHFGTIILTTELNLGLSQGDIPAFIPDLSSRVFSWHPFPVWTCPHFAPSSSQAIFSN